MQVFHSNPFAVKLYKCVGCCNTVNDMSNRVCLPNKTEDLNVRGFNMISGKDKSKILTKNISCVCESRFKKKKCNSYQWWNNDKLPCECKKGHVCEKQYIWNPATSSCENGKYSANIMNDLAFLCDETMDTKAKSNGEEIKSVATSFNEKEAIRKIQKFYILLSFLLISLILLIAVSI